MKGIREVLEQFFVEAREINIAVKKIEEYQQGLQAQLTEQLGSIHDAIQAIGPVTEDEEEDERQRRGRIVEDQFHKIDELMEEKRRREAEQEKKTEEKKRSDEGPEVEVSESDEKSEGTESESESEEVEGRKEVDKMVLDEDETMKE
jgi:hypothetical protein